MVKSDSKRSHGTTVALTPALFTELDTIARTVAGNALEVVAAEEMPNTIARVNYLMGCGYRDSRIVDGVCMMDLSIIQIANRIDVDQVHSWPRPELDYSKIDADEVYRFALWHEIGHRLGDLDKWGSVGASLEDHGVVRWLNEVRADRFAWRKVYPKRPLPRYGKAKPRHEIDVLMRRMVGRYPCPIRAPRPLPTQPYLAIPASHVRRGIPWA